AAIAGRPMEQRQDAFLVAADVADHEGVSEIEDKALTEIAAALIVDKAALMQTAVARTTPSLSA
ncbi:Tellurite resistance protein TerB, partial [Methylobacterium sp. WL2]